MISNAVMDGSNGSNSGGGDRRAPYRPSSLAQQATTSKSLDACDDGGFEEVNLDQPTLESEPLTPVNEDFSDFNKSFPMMGVKRNRPGYDQGYFDTGANTGYPGGGGGIGTVSGFSSSTSGTDAGVMLR